MSQLCNALARKAALKLGKHAPDICLGLGITSLVTSTVLACKGTLKLESVKEKYQKQLAIIEDSKRLAEETKGLKVGDVYDATDRYWSGSSLGVLQLNQTMITDLQSYTPKIEGKERFQAKLSLAKDLAAMYGPSVVLGGFGIFCLIKGRNILQNRNLALMSAYNLLSSGFDAYRQRVRHELGNVMDDHFRYGTELRKGTMTTVDQDTGKKVKVPIEENVFVPVVTGASIYARVFDHMNPHWTNNDEVNMVTIKSKQDIFNMLLQRDGVVFLNEVYQEFGFPKTKAGQEVGWNNKTMTGDGVILFRVEKIQSDEYGPKEASAFMIDFNVDGPVYNELNLEV